MLITSQININSIRNKLEPLVDFMNNNLEIVMISEVNSDDTFPDSQFLIEGFPVPYKPDLTVKGGGILLYISEDLP